MDSLYLLIPIALVFCAIAIKLLLWAIGSGQYDDLDKEAWRILADDPPPTPKRNQPDLDESEKP
ncbi:MAG: cbb3-type cytochrome oxidase assembly protein CcoS [Gammaproteobacteria bacterium]|nr:cbb3-type cytochrome oxidase assembly protein CcoS [Gammaproteobacteria bacterium]